MREKLNSNPLAQLAVIGVLLLGTAFFVFSSSGGGEEEAESTEATVSVVGTDATGSATGATPGEALEGAIGAATEGAAAGSLSSTVPLAGGSTPAPPLPRPVLEAWRANQTLVLLFVRDDGIDDRLVKDATASLEGFSDTAVFVVPAAKIARYAAISEGVGVERVPALVVVTPKHLERSVPTASVSYGFQSPQSIAQAMVDAGYEGPTVDYHP